MRFVKSFCIYPIIFFIFSCGPGGGGSNGAGSENTVPVANAGADQKGELNTVIILDGSGSSDADGDPLTYSWTLTSTPTGSTATLSDSDIVSPTLIPDIGGIYIASLIVNDGYIDSSSDTVTVTAGFLFPDYDPLGSFTNCTATYEWTVGTDTGQQFTIISGGSETVNYVSGALTGTIINGGRNTLGATTYNDGTSYKILRADTGVVNVYLSNDCVMTAHPEGWSFDIVYDGMLLDQGSYYFVDVNDSTNCMGPETQQILFTVQDVTVQGTLYNEAVIQWTIDENYAFATVSDPKLTSIGIISPTSTQTGGNSVTDIDISANGTGMVAGGDVDAQSGTLNDFAELISASCN